MLFAKNSVTPYRCFSPSPHFPLKKGLTPAEIDSFFGGPAFLAWARMGNLKGWGGPLPLQWGVDKLQLQKQILQRMFEFGMTPVLPGFAGFVPDAFTRIHPKAEVKRLHWQLEPPYDGVLQLQPTEDVFKVIGGKFVAKMRQMFFGGGGGGRGGHFGTKPGHFET